jgi:hypothetical protein
MMFPVHFTEHATGQVHERSEVYIYMHLYRCTVMIISNLLWRHNLKQLVQAPHERLGYSVSHNYQPIKSLWSPPSSSPTWILRSQYCHMVSWLKPSIRMGGEMPVKALKHVWCTDPPHCSKAISLHFRVSRWRAAWGRNNWKLPSV